MTFFTPLLIMCQAYLNCTIGVPPVEFRALQTFNSCMEYHLDVLPKVLTPPGALEEFKQIPWVNIVCHETSEQVSEEELAKLATEKYGMPKKENLPVRAF